MSEIREDESQQQLVQLRAAADLSTQVRSILAADDLRRLDLAGTTAAPAASGRAFWSQREGLVVVFANLPATDAGQVYQLWVIPPGGNPIDAGMMAGRPFFNIAGIGFDARVARLFNARGPGRRGGWLAVRFPTRPGGH